MRSRTRNWPLGFRGAWATVVAGAFLVSSCTTGSKREPLMIFAAASATDAVTEIAEVFERESGVAVRCNFAASSALARQIEAGAEADVFLSANEKWADVLERNGRIEARRDLLGNALVVVVPVDSKLAIATPEDLLGRGVGRISLADPESVPAGIYAREALLRLGLWNRLESKVVRGFDVRQALLFVERGEAEAGMVYATDAAISKSVRVALELDAGLNDPIRYPLVLLRRDPPSPSARRLYEYIGTEPARNVFRKLGFKIVGNGV